MYACYRMISNKKLGIFDTKIKIHCSYKKVLQNSPKMEILKNRAKLEILWKPHAVFFIHFIFFLPKIEKFTAKYSLTSAHILVIHLHRKSKIFYSSTLKFRNNYVESSSETVFINIKHTSF